MKNRVLLGLLLLAAAVILLWRPADRDDTFRDVLLDLDTSGITALAITEGSQPECILKRERNHWIITRGELVVRADPPAMDRLLQAIRFIRAESIAAKTPGDWADYGLDADQGIRVGVTSAGQAGESFYLGLTDTFRGVSYVRLEKGPEVYAVNRQLRAEIWPGAAALRPRTLLRAGQKDSVEVYNFSDSLLFMLPFPDTALLEGGVFADWFEPSANAEKLAGKLVFGKGGPVIWCYSDSSWSPPFVLGSSLSPESWFESDSAGLYRRLFSGQSRME